MPRTSSADNETEIVDGHAWKKCWLEDKSGSWFELAGPFGELIVEDDRRQQSMISWWPPGIKEGGPVQVGGGYPSREAAMKAGMEYIRNLSAVLNAQAGGLAS